MTQSMAAGESRTFLLTVTDEDDARVDLTGALVRMDVANIRQQQIVVVTKSSANASEIEIPAQTGDAVGTARIHLVPSDTRDLDPTSYAFDVWVVLASGARYRVVPPTVLTIEPAITSLE